MSTITLSELERWWPNFKMERHEFAAIRVDGALTTATSGSGSAMVLLCGLEVRIGGNWIKAHLSFPPDKTDELGYFKEGHLKLEMGGDLLNQYFFSCDDKGTWEVEKLGNSPTVPTREPGNWADIPDDLWNELEKLVTHLAYLEKPKAEH